MKNSTYILTVIFSLIFLTICSCVSDKVDSDVTKSHKGLLFKNLDSEQTGIDFINEIEETWERNTMVFDYFYNGGGVGIGDINNDGLADIFFSGNDSENKLYLNKGDMKFEDISDTALPKVDKWCTGVNMIDINNDGFLDIYVCTSGPVSETDSAALRNVLYLNNGDLTFSEEAEAFGLDVYSRAIQSSFFDQDNDGDLDLWLSNHAILTSPDIMEWSNVMRTRGFDNVRHEGTYVGKNEDGYFVDYTAESFAFFVTFGLGIAPADYDDDGDIDMYIANDYFVPDMYYTNDGKGKYVNKLRQYFDHTSFYSMGTDAADINNDDLMDLVVVDMTPGDHVRNKTLMESMDADRFKFMTEVLGFVKQFMFNSVQLGVGLGGFSEVGQMMGVSQTEWSWAVLLADFDNDGYKDYFVSNGFYRETKDNDFKNRVQAFADSAQVSYNKDIFDHFVSQLASIPIQNNVFSNNKGEKFIDKTTEWFEDVPSFSNGAAYGDLDNDGDLDLVVNNLMSKAFIMENLASGNNWLKVKLVDKVNPASVNFAQIKAYKNEEVRRVDYSFMRGYQSSMEPIAHLGLGSTEILDSLVIKWMDGKKTVINDVATNQMLELDRALIAQSEYSPAISGDLFLEITNRIADFQNIKHVENSFDDFQKEVLLPHKYSDLGPAFDVADINGDGFDDFYLGGSMGNPGMLFIQIKSRFQPVKLPDFQKDANYEDIGAHFFDADGDGDMDLYVASGGGGDVLLDATLTQDRLYINKGNGLFEKDVKRLPYIETSTQDIVSFDYDSDGDMDLLVGARNKPGYYPLASRSLLLTNNGGYFDETDADFLKDVPGMVTGIETVDFNGDNRLDLVIVGEWSIPKFFENTKDGFKNIDVANLNDYSGWWQSISTTDLDNDGDLDLVIGNLGENNKWKASKEKPLGVLASDFDMTGSHDIVLTKKYKGEEVPVRGKECSTQQMPFLDSKFETYKEFATSNIIEILGEDEIQEATRYEAKTFKSIVLRNNGNFKFDIIELPAQAQWAPIKEFIFEDFDGNGFKDILIGGNIKNTEPETVSYDAGKGAIIYNNGDFDFEVEYRLDKTGLLLNNDLRHLKKITLGTKQQGLIVANNNIGVQLFLKK